MWQQLQYDSFNDTPSFQSTGITNSSEEQHTKERICTELQV